MAVAPFFARVPRYVLVIISEAMWGYTTKSSECAGLITPLQIYPPCYNRRQKIL